MINDKSGPVRNAPQPTAGLRESSERCLLFDLDGTLIDGSRAIRSSLAHALESVESTYPRDLAVATLIGIPLLDIFRDQFGIVGEHAERAIAHYRRHFDETAAAGTRVYEHVHETLDLFKGEDFGVLAERHTFDPHAVEAAEVTSVGDRYAQIGVNPIKGIDE